jgi:hypothetical protein
LKLIKSFFKIFVYFSLISTYIGFSMKYNIGAGHGGRGGGTSYNRNTGAAYGQIYEPVDRGCAGGSSTAVSGTGGNGGGKIYIRVTEELQNDGQISCNGASGTGAAGGGSGGSILMDIANIKVNRTIELY